MIGRENLDQLVQQQKHLVARQGNYSNKLLGASPYNPIAGEYETEYRNATRPRRYFQRSDQINSSNRSLVAYTPDTSLVSAILI